MWPPLREVTSINSSRISCASCGSWAWASAFTSAGPAMVERSEEADGTELIEKGREDRRLFRAGGFKRLEGGDAVLRAFQFLDLELGILEAGFTHLEQL